jgi:hypothetical protein
MNKMTRQEFMESLPYISRKEEKQIRMGAVNLIMGPPGTHYQ